MQRDRAINSRLLHLVGTFLTANGVDFEKLATACGIDLTISRLPEGEVRFADFLQLLETASQHMGRDDLGTRLAEQLPLRLTGIYHYLTTNAATLRDEAIASSQYLGLITNAYTASFSESGGHGWVTFEFRNDTGSRKQFVDLQVAAVVVRIRQIIEDPMMPIRIELERPEPLALATFERVMGNDVHFNAPVNRIGLQQRLLARPIPGADAHLFEELQKVGSLLLKLKSREDNIVETLSDFIVNALPRGDATPEQASKNLNVSERTLQRNLAAANTTFSKIIDETRQRMALHFLADTETPLTQIAFLLGFSELSAFSRAAKSWFGDTPSAIRKRSRPGFSDDDGGSSGPEPVSGVSD